MVLTRRSCPLSGAGRGRRGQGEPDTDLLVVNRSLTIRRQHAGAGCGFAHGFLSADRRILFCRGAPIRIG